ncbi:hypothetical protein DSECCO2_98210 [anaerobic digester metagenome]
MSYEKYQKSFEESAEKAYNEYLNCSETELIEIISRKHWDSTYQIWNALKVVGSEKSIKILYEIVSNLKNDYLIRYHACETLFHIADIKDEEFKGVIQYGLDRKRKEVNQTHAIEKLKEMLKQKFNNNVC